MPDLSGEQADFLRRYIEDEPAHPRHLLTVRGVGYRFVKNPDAGG